MEVVRDLNADGAMTTVDILGEGVTEKPQALRARDDYLSLLDEISKRGVDGNVSVKLTQLGLKLGEDFCLENIRAVVSRAAELNSFIRLDMEDSSCTDATLRIHKTILEEFPGRVGVAIQSYLRRSMADVLELAKLRSNIRLCKGIYVEPYEISYTSREIIRRNFVELLEVLLDAGSYVGIATHDEILVWETMKIVRRRGLSRDAYEFQMLLGVLEGLRKVILGEGHRLRVYVPYGPNWYAYSVRRLRENPRLAGDLAKKAFGLISDNHRD
jgi:proline dehydrogenase